MAIVALTCVAATSFSSGTQGLQIVSVFIIVYLFVLLAFYTPSNLIDIAFHPMQPLEVIQLNEAQLSTTSYIGRPPVANPANFM